MSVQEAAKTGNLILNSLEVKNFRAFRHLTIEKLGRVNLITGRNNVGKTSLLEALMVFAESGGPNTLKRILTDRDEMVRTLPSTLVKRRSLYADEEESIYDVSSFRALFYGRPSLEAITEPITIGARSGSRHAINIDISWFREERRINQDASGTRTLRRVPVPVVPGEAPNIEDAFPYVSVSSGGGPVYNMRLDRFFEGAYSVRTSTISSMRYQYVRANGVTRNAVGRLWDNAVLASLENDIVSSLKLIIDNVEKVNLIGDAENPSVRVPFVKIMSMPGPVPLRSFGDGVNRVFGTMLSLVNAANGLAIVDEVENGIHFTVLSDTWRLILDTAKRLNVQVFATTHSWDCIEAFQKAVAEDEDPSSGALIRLQNRGSDIVATVFDEEELEVVTRQQIEVR